jgi:hypothetical protein
VGEARARAAEIALERYHGPRKLCWLANTDADSVVPATWLKDHLRLAQRGAHTVAGTVDVDSFEEHENFVKDRFRQSYLILPNGSHPHVHGANFGVAPIFIYMQVVGDLCPLLRITISGID